MKRYLFTGIFLISLGVTTSHAEGPGQRLYELSYYKNKELSAYKKVKDFVSDFKTLKGDMAAAQGLIATYEDKLTEKERELTRIQIDLRKKILELHELSKKINDRKKQVDQLDEEKKALKEQYILSVREKEDALNTRIADLETEIQSMKDHHARLIEEKELDLKTLQEENLSLKENVRDVDGIKESLQKKISFMEREIDGLNEIHRQAIDEKEEEIKALGVEKDSYAKEYESLRLKEEELVNKIALLEKEINGLDSEKKRNIDLITKPFKEEIRRLKEKSETTSQEFQRVVFNEKGTLEEENRRLQDLLKQKEASVSSQIEQAKAPLLEEIDQLETRLMDLITIITAIPVDDIFLEEE